MPKKIIISDEKIEEVYQRALKEVFGEDGHGNDQAVDEEKMKEKMLWFCEMFLRESDKETFTIHIATSPMNAQEMAQKMIGTKKYVSPLLYPWMSDRRFLKYYECLTDEQLKNVNLEEEAKQAKQLTELLNLGVYNCLAVGTDTDIHIIVTPMFSWISVDTDGRLHSLDAPAVAWRDGYKEYAILGIFFDETVWKRIVNKELTAKKIVEWKNDDEKAAILSVYGAEWMIEAFNAEIVDTYTLTDENRAEHGFYCKDNTYTLYLVKNAFPKPEYFLGYTCPSTGRKYFEAIPPKEGKKGAQASIAWRFSTDAKSFDKLKYHA